MEVTSAPRVFSLISPRVMNGDLNRTERERISMVQETFDPRGIKDARKGDGLANSRANTLLGRSLSAFDRAYYEQQHVKIRNK